MAGMGFSIGQFVAHLRATNFLQQTIETIARGPVPIRRAASSFPLRRLGDNPS
jgi:hypothetical protein